MGRVSVAEALLAVTALATAGPAIDTEILVALKPGEACAVTAAEGGAPHTGNAALDALNQRLGCTHMARALPGRFGEPELAEALGLDRTYHLRFPSSANLDSVLAAFRRLDCVEYAEPNGWLRALGAEQFYPNDYYFDWLWGLDNRLKWGWSGTRWPDAKPDADIDAPEAWEITTGDSSVVAAIIDSGCKTSHPELAGRIWRNPRETPGNGRDDDNNGYVDDVNGWDFWFNDNVPEDSAGHGTGVAGVLAANGNNGILHAGVDWKCKIMPLKVFGNDTGGTNVLFLSEALRYAADNGADVVNMSLGDSRANRFLENAVNYAAGLGVVMVAAAGNDNREGVLYPAAYTAVIAVGATDPNDHRSWCFGDDTTRCGGGSNYGAALDVVAPGNHIYFLDLNDTVYDHGSGGTSLATPLVTGIASLLLAQDPSRTPAQIRTIIQETADDTVGAPTEDTPGWDKYMGHGRVSAFQAVAYGMTGNTRSAVRPFLGLAVSPRVIAAGNALRVRTGGGVGDGWVEVMRPDGSVVARRRVPLSGSVAVERLAPGSYVYRIRAAGVEVAMGRVMVGR